MLATSSHFKLLTLRLLRTCKLLATFPRAELAHRGQFHAVLGRTPSCSLCLNRHFLVQQILPVDFQRICTIRRREALIVMNHSTQWR